MPLIVSGKLFRQPEPALSDDARWITGDTIHVDGGSKF
jgi:hypothetical protein